MRKLARPRLCHFHAKRLSDVHFHRWLSTPRTGPKISQSWPGPCVSFAIQFCNCRNLARPLLINFRANLLSGVHFKTGLLPPLRTGLKCEKAGPAAPVQFFIQRCFRMFVFTAGSSPSPRTGPRKLARPHLRILYAMLLSPFHVDACLNW